MVTIFLANLIWINYLKLLILVNNSTVSEHKQMKWIESPWASHGMEITAENHVLPCSP